MAGVVTPEWLAKRGGVLRPATTGGAWLVLVDNSPQYRLVPVPAAGKYGCDITQTVNGRRLQDSGAHASAEDAIRGGLEELRKVLGWN